MKVNDIHKYDHDVDTIFAFYTNKKAIKKKMKALGSRKIDVEVEEKKKSTKVKIVREVPAEVPTALKKFVGSWNRLTQKEVWKGAEGGPYKGEITIDFEGMPLTIVSSGILKSVGEGCTNNIETEIKCSIPFVGKMLAKFVADQIKVALEDEYDYIKENA